MLEKFHVRKAISKLRLSAHNLLVETPQLPVRFGELTIDLQMCRDLHRVSIWYWSET